MENHVHRPGCGCAGFELSNEGKKIYIKKIDDNLFDVIDIAGLECLNAEKPSTVRNVFRREDERMDEVEQCLESPEGDPEIILIIPFTEEVKIRAVQLITTSEDMRPSLANMFINEENIDFSLSEEIPLQDFVLDDYTHDNQIEIQTKITKFVRVQKLVIHLNGETVDQIGLRYIGVKGIRTKVKRQIVHAKYEKAPMVSDHKNDIKSLMKNGNSSLI